ncbi:MAG: hypothetical protein R6V32_11735 [Bacteroidales bacterium]
MQQYAGIKQILLLLLLLLVTSSFFLFVIIPAVKSSSGGYGLIDTMFFASEQTYRETLSAYTSKTRMLHYLSTSLDMVLPLIYGGLIILTTLRYCQNFRLLKPAVAICISAVLLDYLENAGILFSISHYHNTGGYLIKYLQVTTTCKFILLGFSLVFLIICICRKGKN